MVEGLKLWAERFEIKQEQREDEVRVWLKFFLVLFCRIEPHQFTARVFEITLMRRGEGDFMTRVELDNITVYLNDIHLAPLSESGAGDRHDSVRGYFCWR